MLLAQFEDREETVQIPLVWSGLEGSQDLYRAELVNCMGVCSVQGAFLHHLFLLKSFLTLKKRGKLCFLPQNLLTGRQIVLGRRTWAGPSRAGRVFIISS